jgi:serine protease Do
MDNNNQYQSENGAQWNAPEAHWNGSNYSSGGSKPPKKKSGVSLKVTIIACVCSGLVAIGASAGTFAALANTGSLSGNAGATQITATTTTNSDGSSSALQATSTSTSTEDADGTLQAATAKALKSVVLLQVYTKSGGTSYGSYYGFSFGEDQQTEQLSSEGSGVIATSDGYIITNNHLVSGASSVKVTLASGDIYDAEIIGTDSVTDLALLKIDATNLDAAEFGSSGDLQVGDRVIAVGNPGGSLCSSSATYGFVSALNRTVTTSSEYKMTCIQTDAAVNPGNSGGALVNSQGQVVGIVSSKLVSTSYEGLGFAIPIDTALPIINDLRENGYVSNRAILGVSGQFIDSMTAMYYNLSTGFYVSSVNNESASEAGLTRGDIITAVDGTTISSNTALTNLLLEKTPGDTATLTVDRDGETLTIDITLQKYSGDSSSDES